MAQGGFTQADLLAAEAAAEIEALFQRAKRDRRVKASTITSLGKTRLDHLRALGLTTIARKNVGPVERDEPNDDPNPLDEFRQR